MSVIDENIPLFKGEKPYIVSCPRCAGNLRHWDEIPELGFKSVLVDCLSCGACWTLGSLGIVPDPETHTSAVPLPLWWFKEDPETFIKAVKNVIAQGATPILDGRPRAN